MKKLIEFGISAMCLVLSALLVFGVELLAFAQPPRRRRHYV